MKKIFIYIVLASFIIQSCSQLVVLTSFYINRDYIAENFCINRFDAITLCEGQCFLDKELKQNEQKQEKHYPDFKLNEIMLFKTTFISFVFSEIAIFQKKTFLPNYGSFLSDDFVFLVFHPPRKV